MLSSSANEIDKSMKRLCSNELYKKKLSNLRKYESDFDDKVEICHGLPIQVHLEPAGVCNLTCSTCPRGQGIIRRSGFLSYETFHHLINPFAETLGNIIISGFWRATIKPGNAAHDQFCIGEFYIHLSKH